MKSLLVRVNKATLKADSEDSVSIGQGLVAFVGFCKNDSSETAKRLAGRIGLLRIFEDKAQKMNVSLIDCGYQILCVPNFTLYARMSSGRRPSFDDCMKHESAGILFDEFVGFVLAAGLDAKRGYFGKHMSIAIDSDGPVNILLQE